MAESFSMAGYEWISFYLSNLFNDLGSNFGFDFNNNSDFINLSDILAAGMYESEVDNWLKIVKSALYEAEDLQDQYLLLEDRLRKGSQIVTHVPSCPLIRPFEKMTQKILNASSKKKHLFGQLKRLSDLISEASFFSRALGILDKPVNENQCREKSSALQTVVLGCDGECESIIKLLVGQKSQDSHHSSSQSNSTVAIIGQSGCGKTTLAQYIFNDVRIARHFETRIWLCVSGQKLDIYSHTSKMVKSILVQEFLRPENQEALLLKRILEDEMKSSNTLFVLDDVQGSELSNTTSVIDDVSGSGLANNNTSEVEKMNVDEDWEQLLASFSGFSRCKILVTSQSHKLPLPLRSSYIFPKFTMTEQDLFSLLMHSAFGDHRGRQFIPPDVERIGHVIVKRLNFPADAKLIGSELRAQTDAKAWEKVLERVNLSEKPTDIYLRLTEPLKRCFLFCSIFPNGYKHEMQNLIQLWMAECFIKSPDPVRRAEDIGKEYFQELLTSSVFTPIQEQESDILLYTMDDLFHHLADHMSADDCFRLEGSDGKEIPSSVYHLSVHTEKLMEHRSKICELHNLRTLILFGPAVDGSHEIILDEIFFNLKKLRVLDISLYNCKILPKSIGDLKQLRYLNHSTTVTKLPKSIHKIQNLQFLKHKPGC